MLAAGWGSGSLACRGKWVAVETAPESFGDFALGREFDDEGVWSMWLGLAIV